MSDDPRVTVPAELVDALREAVDGPDKTDLEMTIEADRDTLLWAARRLVAAVDAAERPTAPPSEPPTRPPRPPACEKCDALWTPGHVCAPVPVGEPLCRCGHPRGMHSESGRWCSGPHLTLAKTCDCTKYDPTPHPVPVSDEAEAYEAFVNWYGADVGGPTSYEMKQTFVAGFRAARLAGKEHER